MSESNTNSTIVPVQHSLRRMIKDYVSFRPWLTVLIVICIVISSACTIVSSIVISPIVDGISELQAGDITYDAYINDTVWPLLTFMIVAYCIGLVAMIIYTVGMAWLGQAFMTDLRNRVFQNMQTLPLSFFDRNQTGDIMSVYTNDIDTLRQFIVQALQSFISCGVTLVFLVAMMMCYSLFLMIISVVAVAVMVICAKELGKRSSRYFTGVQDWTGNQEGFIEEMMGGLKVVKSFNHETASRDRFDDINENLRKCSTQAHIYSNIIGPILNHIGILAYVIIALVGCTVSALGGMNYGFTQGYTTMTLGIVLAFIPLAQQVTGNVNQLGQQLPYISMSAAGCGRVYAVLDTESEVDNGYVTLAQGEWLPDGSFQVHEHPDKRDAYAWRHEHQVDHTVTYVPLKGDIQMYGVDFSYEPGKQVLKDISVYAKPGQKVALVGATGAGKTTITNLLNRFYDIEDGKIRYDGININKIRKRDLRRSIGIVLQDTSLFTGTIMDNIRYGRLDATDEECIEAAKLANADSFIRMLPQGYNTVIEGDGSSLSQGQCQLLSIARVAVADPPVLILDEATSSIDTRTEAIVTDGMDKLMEGRTVFAIAHRLSTIRNSNVIIVMEHGRIIERGDHEQLLAQKGLYYQLYTGTTELE